MLAPAPTRALRRAGIALAGLLAAPTAVAHSPIEGIGEFYAGILHPVLVPSHVLALLSLGLLLGQRGLDAMRVGYCAFLPAVVLGLVAAGAGVTPVAIEPWLLALSILCALAVVLRLRLPLLVAGVLAALVALAVGLDSSPEITGATRAAAALAGSGLGACICLILFAALAELPQHDWQRIAVRVVASWSAASGALVLSLRWLGAA